MTRDLAGVTVLEECRGRGLGLELVREIAENGPQAGRRWVLHTRDMHGLDEKLGFGPDERLMERPVSPRERAARTASSRARRRSLPA